MPRPNVICLTPVRNESWILGRFLRCASLWADHIVIADQRSDDGSREIARAFPKVRLVENAAGPLAEDFDEAVRQRMLLDEARRIEGPRLLIALDADEVLTAGAWHTAEWAAMLDSAPGTVFRFRSLNLRPGLASCWLPPERAPWAFMDDGSEHSGLRLHSPRIPLPPEAPEVELDEIRVLHYQYTDWARMRSKHRWYQCLERRLRPRRGALEVYRQYHHMDAVPSGQELAVRRDWFAAYERQGIDMTSVSGGAPYWFERAVVEMLVRHGASHFRRQAIWDVDWRAAGVRHGYGGSERFADSRSRRERAVHRWLQLTQPHQSRRVVRWTDRWLQSRGW